MLPPGARYAYAEIFDIPPDTSACANANNNVNATIERAFACAVAAPSSSNPVHRHNLTPAFLAKCTGSGHKDIDDDDDDAADENMDVDVVAMPGIMPTVSKAYTTTLRICSRQPSPLHTDDTPHRRRRLPPPPSPQHRRHLNNHRHRLAEDQEYGRQPVASSRWHIIGRRISMLTLVSVVLLLVVGVCPPAGNAAMIETTRGNRTMAVASATAEMYARLMDVEFGSEAAAMTRRPRRSPIYQNEFAVYIPSGAAAADAVAARYGFTNEGQVSEGRLTLSDNMMIKVVSMLSLIVLIIPTTKCCDFALN